MVTQDDSGQFYRQHHDNDDGGSANSDKTTEPSLGFFFKEGGIST